MAVDLSIRPESYVAHMAGVRFQSSALHLWPPREHGDIYLTDGTNRKSVPHVALMREHVALMREHVAARGEQVLLDLPHVSHNPDRRCKEGIYAR